ncbi:hypothetical protein GCM10009823_28280 [Brevibacterium salitolerans]|uniref:Uncharacterized protein n=1 Tax=Brevibacterium salitolerans TaxID=1403566 RepID=A0ABP5INW2_9MICO
MPAPGECAESACAAEEQARRETQARGQRAQARQQARQQAQGWQARKQQRTQRLRLRSRKTERNGPFPDGRPNPCGAEAGLRICGYHGKRYTGGGTHPGSSLLPMSHFTSKIHGNGDVK